MVNIGVNHGSIEWPFFICISITEMEPCHIATQLMQPVPHY